MASAYAPTQAASATQDFRLLNDGVAESRRLGDSTRIWRFVEKRGDSGTVVSVRVFPEDPIAENCLIVLSPNRVVASNVPLQDLSRPTNLDQSHST